MANPIVKIGNPPKPFVPFARRGPPSDASADRTHHPSSDGSRTFAHLRRKLPTFASKIPLLVDQSPNPPHL